MGVLGQADRLAKISQPRTSKVYSRTRLFKRLDLAGDRSVAWVSGPPGMGKTTLAASYLAERKRTALWYTLDAGDSDVATFFHYLGLAVPGTWAPNAVPRLTPERRAGLEIFARRYFEQLYAALTPPLTIVFDNYHTVPEGSALHDVFRWGFDLIPAGVNIIVVSREAPPNALGRLESSRALVRIDSPELSLRLSEARGIARLWKKWDSARSLIPALHRATEGWAAGLILMLEHGSPDGAALRRVADVTRDNRFRYFGGEILDDLDRDTREVLLKTSILPAVSVDIARELTGNARAGRVLAHMHRRGFFTDRVGGTTPIYRYHPLFREFLLETAFNAYGTESIAALRGRARDLLEQAGELEQAAGLCREMGDWTGLGKFCRRLAPVLLAQGRTELLKEWLGDVAAHSADTPPWLEYWLGRLELAFDPDRARRHFEEAHKGNRMSGEREMMLEAWCGVVDAIVYSWDDYARLDPWIALGEQENGNYPSKQTEARMAVSMFSALMFRMPGHPRIDDWSRRGLTLARESGDPALLIRMIDYLSHYCAWIGDHVYSKSLLEESGALVDSGDVPAIVVLGYHMQAAVYHWLVGEFSRAVAAVEEGLELARREGVHLLDTRLAAQGAYALLGNNDPGGAEHYLEAMNGALERGGNLDIAHYHYLRGWHALVRGDHAGALHEAGCAVELADRLGAPFPRALTGLSYARALHANGLGPEAARHRAASRQLAGAMGSRILQYHHAMVEAEAHLDAGDHRRCAQALTEGLACARLNGYRMTPGWDAAMMARLYDFALEHRIESEWARDSIRRGSVPLPADMTAGPEWPWPVRIHALGGFRVERNDAAVEFPRKAQKKPMELLRVLIALGGRDVSEERLADHLWPDADGDAAMKSLATTLYRVRKLLDCSDALIRREGRVTINARLCWVDALAFADALAQSAGAGDEIKVRRCLRRAARWYGGRFLPGEEDGAWSLAIRERLEEQFVDAVSRLARDHEMNGDMDEAQAWCRYGIERAPAAVALYQYLARLYSARGETELAAEMERRCRKAMGDIAEPVSREGAGRPGAT